ncbi:hypothetical protein [Persephonella sp.]
MKRIFKFAVFSVALITAGCGVKGSPQPPFTTAPETVKDVKIKQQDGQLVVYWRYTPLYADGRKMDERFRFEIFTLDHRVVKKINRKGNLYWFTYKFSSDREYCFRFQVITSKNKSRYSRYFCYIPTLNYPREKPEISLSIVEEGIKIEWNITQLKINIYRNDRPVYYPIPYTAVDRGYSFTDKKVVSGKNYCYYLTFEDRNGVETEPSPIKCITFRDIFPPLPPQNPQIIQKDGVYYLVWSDSPSKDVKGYMIYVDGTPVTPRPVRDYIIELPWIKKGSVITIVAVDRAGNRSRPVTLELSNGQP